MSKRVVGIFWLIAILSVFTILGTSNLGLTGMPSPISTQAVEFDDYVGAESCATCHQSQYNSWAESYHNNAGLINITSTNTTDIRYYWVSPAELHNGSTRVMNQTDFSSCASCHVTGYDEATGTWPNWNSSDPEDAAQFLGVQCEVCHGPFQDDHWDTDVDMLTSYSAEICASCHRQPDDWALSGHSQSLIVLQTSDHASDSCLRCMSTQGSLGLNVTLDDPDLEPISCVACHDPHDAENEFQLIQEDPLATCQQCHDAPDHHLNYQIFIDGPHELAGLDCTSCHGQGTRLWHGSESQWFNHTFWIYNTVYPYNQTDPMVCIQCHDQTWASTQLGIIQGTFSEMMANVTTVIEEAEAAISEANTTSGVDQTKVDEAVALLSTAEDWLNFLEGDDSGGLHNPERSWELFSDAYRLAFEAESIAQEAQQTALSGEVTRVEGELATSQTYLYVGALGAIVVGLAIGMVVGRRWGK